MESSVSAGISHDARSAADVGVDHGRADVLVAEQLLHGANIIAILQQMRSKTVPEGVATGGFGNAGRTEGGKSWLI